MDTAYVVLIGGGMLSALVGLLGIAVSRLENTPILNQLTEEELRSYRTQRLVSEGISWCTIGNHDFRPGPSASLTACPICLPPPPKPGKWEPHTAPAHPTRTLNFGRAYQPLTWLYQHDDREDDNES